MKRKIILMSIAGVLAMTAMIGGTLAGFQTQSRQGRTDITTKSLGIELTGSETLPEKEILAAEADVPGAEVSMPLSVSNSVDDGYELYTRVTIYKYWEDKDNEKLDPEKIGLYVRDADGKAVELTDCGGNGCVRAGDWFVQYADEEQVILYYARPLMAGESTSKVLDFVMVDAEAGNDYADQNIVVEVQADAVQRIAADAAIPSEWGVYPVFDADGNILSIAE